MIDIDKIKKKLKSALHEIEYNLNVEEGELLHEQISDTLELLKDISNKDVFSLEEVKYLMNWSKDIGKYDNEILWDEDCSDLLTKFYEKRKTR